MLCIPRNQSLLAYSGLFFQLLVFPGLFGTMNYTFKSFLGVMPPDFLTKQAGLILLLQFPESGSPLYTGPG